MTQFPFLPLWTDTWIADTDHLTRCERGMYLDMLLLCWRSPQCRIPNEIPWIVRKLRVTPDEMPTLESLIKEFMTSTGNWLSQKRLTEEYERAGRTSKKQSGIAKSRWEKKKKSARAMPETETWHASGNASKPILRKKVSKRETIVSLVANDAFDTFWATYPKRSGTNSKAKAKEKYDLLVKQGVGAEVMLDGAMRYAAFCDGDGKTGTQYVQQTTRWLNEKGWETDYVRGKPANGQYTLRESFREADQILSRRSTASFNEPFASDDRGQKDTGLLSGLRKGSA